MRSSNPGTGVAAALLSGLAQGLAAAGADKACLQFSATLMTLDQDAYTPYQYVISEIEVIKAAKGRVLSLQIDRGLLESYPFTIADRKQYAVAYGRHDKDRGFGPSAITDAELEKEIAKPVAIDPSALALAVTSDSRQVHEPRIGAFGKTSATLSLAGMPWYTTSVRN